MALIGTRALTALSGLLVVALVWGVGSLQGSAPESRSGAGLQTRLFITYDEDARSIVRKAYSVWDPAPHLGLHFEWIPDGRSRSGTALVSGRGQLTWRKAGSSSYDANSVVSVYRGEMSNGRAHGEGAFRTRDGVRYEGGWRNGLYEGQGELQTPDGSTFVGHFKAGAFDGPGTLMPTGGGSFAGHFVNGRQHGQGTTRLASGAQFVSSWADGIEDKTSRVYLSSDTRQLASAGGVEISLQVEPLEFFPDSRPNGRPLSYRSTQTPAAFSILPDHQALMESWKNAGPIGTDCCDFIYTRPIPVTFRVRNLSGRDFEITSSSLQVSESATDLQPLLTMDMGTTCYVAYCPTIAIFNHGWSSPTSARLAATFEGKSGRTGQTSAAIPVEALKGDEECKTFPRLADCAGTGPVLNVEAHLKALRVDVARLKAWSDRLAAADADGQEAVGIPCGTKSDVECLAFLRASGVLGQLANAVEMQGGTLSTTLTGTLAFEWVDIKGNRHNQSSPLRHHIRLGSRTFGTWGSEGGTRPDRDPTAAFPVSFSLDRTNYAIALPWRAVVKNGEYAQVKLLLKLAKMSSEHRFQLALKGSDDRETRSKPVQLLMFVSRLHRRCRDEPDPATPWMC